jgi:hypothetical protein
MIVMGVLLLIVGAFFLLVFVDGMMSGPEESSFYIPGFTLGAAITTAGAWLFWRERRR